MRVDSKETVAGYPVLVIRQALRKLRGIDAWGTEMLEAAADLPTGSGPELVKALIAERLVCKIRKDTWAISQAGMTFTAATAAKLLTRKTAERALAAFMDRVARVNGDPYFLGRVTRVVLFGSLLNPNTDRPSDVDLAVEILPKTEDWDRHVEENNRRVEELAALGHRFRNSVEYAACWYLEVFRFLKGGSRAISLAHYCVEKRLVLAVPHRSCWATMSRRPLRLAMLRCRGASADHGAVHSDSSINAVPRELQRTQFAFPCGSRAVSPWAKSLSIDSDSKCWPGPRALSTSISDNPTYRPQSPRIQLRNHIRTTKRDDSGSVFIVSGFPTKPGGSHFPPLLSLSKLLSSWFIRPCISTKLACSFRSWLAASASTA